MSIFSSFDALCAESVGQKVVFSWASSSNKGVPSQWISEKFHEVKKGKEVNDSSQTKKSEGRLPARRPRFAPELDGVHCFETIIPY